MTRPLIAITPDRSDNIQHIESTYFIRRNYCSAIAKAGGTAIILPYQMDAIDHYLDLADGLVLSGGMFDISPALYGAASKYPQQVSLKPDRTDFETAILQGALARNIPILGICGGMQLIAVAKGASLHQHLPSDIATTIEHKQQPCDQPAHRITVHQGSLLHQILDVDELHINSLHHQAVAQDNIEAGAGVRVSAVADDGVVEAIEVQGHPFCVGVQWHPEYAVNTCESNLFSALVRAAACAGRP
ncbi:gamma-glutamyl-gamma-aminobutyrate hydrolase family protein [Undibacterium terreum]|uniref:Gamma-glutamyl-gamma-aminobutyrate hydrolase n=1 Tax=Undibacterium terreum TaxID=1224302 RepID=A0A916UUF3_9BURK|nr:gamma-glutamyl-gamma-aminobutyrate hydrolase family protein [Undibacterium terreum]GGC88422.1 gamma-glutamyl-gamma-aminobutyrate hydrolase [Undibacterium terreum]